MLNCYRQGTKKYIHVRKCIKVRIFCEYFGITNWYAQLVQLRAPENTSWYRWRRVKVFWRPASMLILGWGQRVIISHATMLNAAALFLPHALHQRKGIAHLLLHIAYCTLYIAQLTILTMCCAQNDVRACGIQYTSTSILVVCVDNISGLVQEG